MKHMGNRASVILLICLILIFSGLSVNAASQPKYGGTLKVGINSDMTSVDPHNNPAEINANVLSHIFDRLVALGENLEILPCLAERWDISSDYRTYTFYLRKGKLFHNGRELEAADVKYSFERLLDPKTGYVKRGELRIKSIEVVDKYTVRFHMTQPDASLLIVMAQTSPVIAPVPREEIEKQGGFFTHPIGTGPYKFVEWKPDRYLLMERFEQYKPDPEPMNGMMGQKIAYLDKIEFIPVPEESVATMAMFNKEVDFLHYVPFKNVQKFQDKPGIEVVQIPGMSFYDIVLGCDKPITKDVRFRKAVAYAVDRGMVMKMATRGYGAVNPSMVPVKSAYHTAYHDKWYEKDVNKAKELLKACGYKGEEIPLMTTKKYAMMYDQSLAVQSELRGVGINVKLVVQDWGTHIKKYFNSEYQMISWGHGPKPDPIITYGLLKSSNFHKEYPKLQEELLPKLAATMDFETRKKLFEEAHSQLIEGVPLIGLFNYYYTSAYWNYVKGFKQYMTNQTRFWNVWLDK